MAQLTLSSGQTLKLGKELGAGGEGAVSTIVGSRDMVAKIYHPHRLNRALEAKLRTMVANAPHDATRNSKLNHVSIAWPTDIVLDNGAFVGYIMPKIPKSDNLYDLLQPQQRAKQHGKLNHRHLYRTARNLAIAMDAIHQKGYVIGDVNFKNALFNDDALITIVDCDSMQVTDQRGIVHHCLVGVPEYTPPELQGKDFATTTRTPQHDAFGLAVLIFQLLMQGFHPFAGRPTPQAPDVEQSHIYCLTKGIFPYLAGQVFVPPKAAPPYVCLPGQLRTLFERAFTQPGSRPTPSAWEHAISLVEQRLIPCSNDAHHYYPSDGHCVICEVDYNVGRRTRTSTAPMSQTTGLQVPLTPPSSTPSRPTPTPATPNRPTSVPQTAPSAKPATAPATSIPPLPQTPATSRPPVATPRRNTNSLRQWVIPIIIIVVAGASILNMFGGNSTEDATPTVAPTPQQVTEPTSTATEVEPTNAIPSVVTAPTAPSTTIGACTNDNIVAAVYPMLPAKQQSALRPAQIATSLNARYPAVISLPELIPNTQTVLPWSTLVDGCQAVGLQLSDPYQYNTASFIGCTSASCPELAQRTVVAQAAALVMRNNDLWPTLNLDASSAALPQFVQGVRSSDSSRIINVAIVSADAPARVMSEQILPIVQKPLVTLRNNKAFWLDQGQSVVSNKSIVGTASYAATSGLTTASSSTASQWVRTVDFTGARWQTGALVSATEYRGWWQECGQRGDDSPACMYIADVTVLDTQRIAIVYVAGLPQSIADTIAPLARPQGSQATPNMEQPWRITAMPDARALELQNEQNVRVTITLYAPSDEQLFLDALRQNDIDLAIVDHESASVVLQAIANSTDTTQLRLELQPSGGVYSTNVQR